MVLEGKKMKVYEIIDLLGARLLCVTQKSGGDVRYLVTGSCLNSGEDITTQDLIP